LPVRLDTNFARLTDSDEFEDLICEICRLEWEDPNTQKRGRSGQQQKGVDVYGQPVDLGGIFRGAQCKLRTTNQQLTKKEIQAEVQSAASFPHRLDALIIVTDAPRDTTVQDIVHEIDEEQRQQGTMRVFIWFWDSICQRIATYPAIMVRCYPDYFANFTTLPMVEKLINRPLSLLTVKLDVSNEYTEVEKALSLRGVRLVTTKDSMKAPWDGDLLDGSLFQYVSRDSSELVAFTHQVLSYAGNNFPIFVILPGLLNGDFRSILAQLRGTTEHVRIFNSEHPFAETVLEIFSSVFEYGYERRGAPATVNLAFRSSPTSVTSTLLDVDWSKEINPPQFPSADTWNEVLWRALSDIKKVVLQQGDKLRIQIYAGLQLPAAVAVGFAFNLRIARIGVWARRTGISDFRQKFWLSDVDAQDDSIVTNWIVNPGHGNSSVVVEASVGFDIAPAVRSYLNEIGNGQVPWVQLKMTNTDQTSASLDQERSVAFANHIAKVIRECNERGIFEIHLFLRTPSALAVLIGQRLHACGRIYLYWFDNPTYKFAFTLQ
jgi:hypothetical protein